MSTARITQRRYALIFGEIQGDESAETGSGHTDSLPQGLGSESGAEAGSAEGNFTKASYADMASTHTHTPREFRYIICIGKAHRLLTTTDMANVFWH